MSEISVTKYQIDFSKMTRNLYEQNQELYQKALVHIRLNELQKKGAYMIRCNKATNKGTKITFAPTQNEEEYQKELERIISDGEKIGLKFEAVKEEGGIE